MIAEYSKQYWIDESYDTITHDVFVFDEEDNMSIQSVTEKIGKQNLDPRSSNAFYLEGREWRKYICKHYLANDLLDKLEDASDPTALMAFVDILTLLNYGMAQTAYNLLSATAVPSELDELKTWLLDALNTIAQD